MQRRPENCPLLHVVFHLDLNLDKSHAVFFELRSFVLHTQARPTRGKAFPGEAERAAVRRGQQAVAQSGMPFGVTILHWHRLPSELVARLLGV